jgi:hypothetical protein
MPKIITFINKSSPFKYDEESSLRNSNLLSYLK